MRPAPRADSLLFVVGDVHVRAALPFAPMLEYVKRQGGGLGSRLRFVINGDFLDSTYANHWNTGHFKRLGDDFLRKQIKEEFEQGHALLAQIRAALPNARIQYVPGNHEAALAYVALYFPELGVILGDDTGTKTGFKHDLQAAMDRQLAGILRRHLETAKLGIEVLDYNLPLKVGPLTILHGHQFKSPAGTAKSYPNDALVVNHFHRVITTPLSDSGREGRPMHHHFNPCMTQLRWGYEKVKSSNHSNGFFEAAVSVKSGLYAPTTHALFADGQMMARP